MKLRDIIKELEISNPNKSKEDIIDIFEEIVNDEERIGVMFHKVWDIIHKYHPTKIHSLNDDLWLLSQKQLNLLYQELQQLKNSK